MSGLQIEKREIVTTRDRDGNEFRRGDPLMLRVRGQDIVCRFIEIKNGYFVTQTLDESRENKYRQGSIEDCVRISGIHSYNMPQPASEGKKEDLSNGEE